MRAWVSFLVVTFIFLPFIGCAKKEQPPDFRSNIRNVIVIAVDTLGARNLSFIGYERKTCPFIDELSQKSVVFNRAYSPKALTLPSFTSLLSGLHPVTHGLQDNGCEIPDELHRLTEDFRDSGFLTVGFSASQVIGSRYGMNKGFDYYIDVVPYEVPATVIIDRVRGFLTSEPQESTLTWRGSDKPLFLFIHFFDPHTDYKPDPLYLSWFADPLYDGPVTGSIKIFQQYNNFEIELNNNDLQHTRDLYDAEIRTFDDNLRILFNIFRETGLLDNSAILFISDHGENLGEHHYITHGNPYEAGLHVPLMFHFPGDLGAGTKINSLVEITDSIPSLMDIANIPVPDGLDGRSLLPLINDPSDADGVGRDFLLACGGRITEHVRTYSVFDGRYRLIKDIHWSQTSLLYDILSDPSEENDIASDNPDLVELYESLIIIMSAGEAPPKPGEMDPETEEMLRSLGYIH